MFPDPETTGQEYSDDPGYSGSTREPSMKMVLLSFTLLVIYNWYTR